MRTILRPCHLAGRDKSKERGWHPHQAFCGQIHTALSPHRAKAAQELLSATKLDKPEPLGWGIPLVASSHLHSPLPELRDHCRSTTKGQHPGVLKSWQGFYCWELYSRSSFSFDKSIAVSYRCFRAGSLRKSTTCHTPKSDVSSIKVKNRFPTPLFERQLSVNAHCKFIFLWDPHPHPFPPPCRKKKKKKKPTCDDGMGSYCSIRGQFKQLRTQVCRKVSADRWMDSPQEDGTTFPLIHYPRTHIFSWSKFAQLGWLHWSVASLHQPRKVKVVGNTEQQVHL